MLWLRGYPDQAVKRAREAMVLAEQVSHPLSLVLAAKTVSEVLLCRREAREAQRLIAEWHATSSKLALPLLTTQARFQRGWALLQEEQADHGVAEMREGLAGMRATGAAMGVQYFLCVLAQGYAACGSPAKGMAILEEALKFAADTGAWLRCRCVNADKSAMASNPEVPICMRLPGAPALGAGAARAAGSGYERSRTSRR